MESRDLGSIPTRGGVIFCFKFFKFCNPNLHNIARSDRIRLKTKNLNICYVIWFFMLVVLEYRLGTVNSKSFLSKVLLRIKWKFELTVHFKHEMLGKNISQ